MVELALCIAVIAVAMVAIIGVLPSGLGVQRQNREDTIIDQDATLLMEALRNGATGFDDITNYLDYVAVTREQPFISLTAPLSSAATTSIFQGPFFNSPNYPVLVRADQILGLLALPRVDYIANPPKYFAQTNRNTVVAQFRAFSGSLNGKILPQAAGAVPEVTQLDQSFRYLLKVEITPAVALPTNHVDNLTLYRDRVLANTLYDLRLTFQWPVFGTDVPARVGGNQKVYRTQVFGRLAGITNYVATKSNDELTLVTDVKPNLRLRRFLPGLATPPSPLSSYQPKSP